MPRDPADIGRTPVHIIILEIEDQLAGVVRAHTVATGRVNQPLRLSSRPGGIEDVERVLCIEWLCRTLRCSLLHQVVPPEIAPGLHLHFAACPPVDDDLLHAGALRERLIDHLLQLYLCATSV